jgi:hypothetical protein
MSATIFIGIQCPVCQEYDSLTVKLTFGNFYCVSDKCEFSIEDLRQRANQYLALCDWASTIPRKTSDFDLSQK